MRMTPLSRFNIRGTLHAGFGHRAWLDQAIEPHLFAPSPELGSIRWSGEATLHLLNLVGGLRMPTYPQKSGCVNIMTSQVTCKYNDLASYKRASLSMYSQRHKPRDDQDTYEAKALSTSPT
jgi:hypothetical protein